ncbi:MAG: DUF4221 family protein [Bacteroidales bacterium]
MKKHIFIFISVIALLAIAYFCAKKDRNNKSNLTKNDIFLFNKSISFKKPVKRNDFFIFNLHAIKSKEVLICTEARRGGDIISYDLESQNFIGKTKNPTNDKIQGILFIDKDEYYMVPMYKNQILKIKNNQIDTILSITIKEIINHNLGTVVDFFPSKVCPLMHHDSVFYVGNLGNSVDNLLHQKFLFGFKVLKDSIVVNKAIGAFPKSIIQKDSCLFPFDIVFSYTIHNNEIIISHPFSDSIFIKPLCQDTIQKIFAKSENIKKLPGFISKEKVSDEEFINKRFISSPMYIGIYYDKYRNVYYRTAKLSADYKEKDGLLNLNNFSFTIIVLDEKLNIIGEQVFKNSDYNPNDLIVSKKGILLRKQNKFSESVTFTLFNINEKYLN